MCKKDVISQNKINKGKDVGRIIKPMKNRGMVIYYVVTVFGIGF